MAESLSDILAGVDYVEGRVGREESVGDICDNDDLDGDEVCLYGSDSVISDTEGIALLGEPERQVNGLEVPGVCELVFDDLNNDGVLSIVDVLLFMFVRTGLWYRYSSEMIVFSVFREKRNGTDLARIVYSMVPDYLCQVGVSVIDICRRSRWR